MQVEILDDPAAAAAERIVAVARAGGHLALSGGSTPRAAYERAARADVDWGGATIWLGDDRCVPPDDERSNWRMLEETLLDRLEGEPPSTERIEGELEVGEAADRYEARLRDGLDTFDLQLLGLGPDGHTASLFPGKPAVHERSRMAVAVPEAGMEPYVPRVSLTFPVINASRSILFLVRGGDKVDAVRRAFASDPDPATPASLVERSAMTLLIDPAAAEGLS